MPYAFSLADMRTYHSYLRTKKQEILFDQAADEAKNEEAEKEDDENDTDFDPNKKREKENDMGKNDDTSKESDDVGTL